MTKKEIEKGAGLLLAAVSGCEQMVELLRAAVHYCYEQEKIAKKLTPKGYAAVFLFNSSLRKSRSVVYTS